MPCFDMQQGSTVKIQKLKDLIVAEHRKAMANAPAGVKATYEAWLKKVQGLIARGVPAACEKQYKLGASKDGEEGHVHVFRFVGTDVVVPVVAAEYQRVYVTRTVET